MSKSVARGSAVIAGGASLVSGRGGVAGTTLVLAIGADSDSRWSVFAWR